MFKQTSIYQSLLRVSRLSPSVTFKVVFNTPEVKEMIIEMNTNDQLYKRGIDAKGTELSDIGGDYSFITKDIKSRKGDIYTHVTLKDTGDFYKSWRVTVMGQVIFIEADTIKDGDDLRQRWGNDILGLTEESKGKLISYAVVKYREYILKQWS